MSAYSRQNYLTIFALSSVGNPTPTSVTYQSPIVKNPDVRSAIEGVKYIAETMKSDEEFSNVREHRRELLTVCHSLKTKKNNHLYLNDKWLNIFSSKMKL